MEKNVELKLGFASILTLLFVVLKLTHVIAWSWLWVLSPLWIGAALALLAAVVVLIVVAVCGIAVQ